MSYCRKCHNPAVITKWHDAKRQEAMMVVNCSPGCDNHRMMIVARPAA